ncbi:MAG: hypothetical protein U9O59_00180 [Actinomycetota bacterium]|nr:hypothetical protein [Actinomycetota bacterium]
MERIIDFKGPGLMTNIWLETFLGKIGKYLIDFLSGYLYYIIPVVIIYGIFLALSSYNLKRIEKRADTGIIKSAKNILNANPDISYIELVSEIDIPWEKIISESSFFPYVSRQSDLWITRTNLSNIKSIVMHDDKKIRIVLERNNIGSFKERPAVKRNLYTEYARRLTGKDKD